MAILKSDRRVNATADPVVLNKADGMQVESWRFNTGTSAPQINDVIELVTLPPGSRVLRIVTANEAMGASATYDMGDSADPNRFTAAPRDVAAAGADVSAETIADAHGHVYASATVLQMTVLGAAWNTDADIDGYVIYSKTR